MKGTRLTRWLGALCLALHLFILPGCWNRVEPEDLALVLMLGFQREGGTGEIQVTVQAANPLQMAAGEEGGGGGSPGNPTWVASAAGPTISGAVKNLNRKSTRAINLTHTEVILLCQDLAREGIIPLIDFLERERKTRAIARIFLVEGDLRRAMETGFPMEEMGATGITHHFEVALDETAVTGDIPLRVMFNRLSQPGFEIVLPRLQVRQGEPGDRESGGGPGGQGEQVGMPLEVSGLAAFHKDRMVGWLDARETRGYNWIRNEMTIPVYYFPSPTRVGELVAVEIHQSSSRMEARVRGEEVTITVTAVVEGRVQETTSPEERLSTQSEVVDILNRRLAREVRDDIQAALQKSQEGLKTDIFGFGNLVYRTRPRDWDRLGSRWEEIYPEIQVEVQVEAAVRRTGLIKDPLQIR